MGKSLSGLAVLVLVGMGSATQADPGFDYTKLIQSQVKDYITRAEDSLQNGRYSEALAVSEFVMLTGSIKVRLDLSNLPDSRKDQAKQAVIDALDLWSPALENQTKFVFVDSGPAQIRVRFQNGIVHLGQEVAGLAVWSRNFYDWGNDNYSGRVSADIRLRSLTVDGEPMSYEAIRHAACHEMGHVLGLWDSPRIGDIMGPMPVNRPSTGPSANEIQVLRDLRHRASMISQASLWALQLQSQSLTPVR